MKKFIYFILMIAFAASIAACSKVDQGYEAAKINTLGSDKGEIEVLGQGWQFYNVFKYDIITNPTFAQDYVWTASKEEGSPTDESITFQSSETLPFKADVGISFSIVPGATGQLYKKYHKTVKQLVDTNLRNNVRDAFNREGSKRPAEKIYGSEKVQFIQDIQKEVQDYWTGLLDIKRIYLIGKLDPPQQVKDAIAKKIEAKQKAQQRENEVAESRAIADKRIAEQRGDTETMKMKADAEAYATLKSAEAKAKAIELVNKQLEKSPQYIEYIKANNWDGKLPTFMGGNTPIPFIDLKRG